MRDIDRINRLIRHIRGVQDNAQILGERLMSRGEFNLGKTLIANSFLHDNSKFFGSEWDFLSVDTNDVSSDELKIGIKQHNRTNRHHPEFYDGGIHDMPKEYVAELVCDWKARSSERGTSLESWILEEGTKRFNFTKNDAVYNTIKNFMSLLLEPPLKNVNEL